MNAYATRRWSDISLMVMPLRLLVERTREMGQSFPVLCRSRPGRDALHRALRRCMGGPQAWLGRAARVSHLQASYRHQTPDQLVRRGGLPGGARGQLRCRFWGERVAGFLLGPLIDIWLQQGRVVVIPARFCGC